MRAFFIDVVDKTVTQIQLGDDFTEISKKIGNGCEYFCCPYVFANNDTLYTDDESLLRPDNIKGGFMLLGYHSKLVGNGVILGTDDEGESVDAKSSIDNIASRITFLCEDECKAYAKYITSRQPIIYTFKTT